MDIGDTVRANIPWFLLHLQAENKAPNTIATYGKAVAQLADFLESKGMPTSVGTVRREHVEAFMVDLQDRGWRPASVAQRFRSLQQFWKWAESEGDITTSPMVKMRAPIVPVVPPEIIRVGDKDRLLATCSGRDFDDRRDRAILLMLMDTGTRRGELAGVRLDDLDLSIPARPLVLVLGKGRRPRSVPFTPDTARAMRHYLKARALHPAAASEWLWLGKRGRLTDNGILQMIRRRGHEAGLDQHIYAHLFRHTAAHDLALAGMSETEMMQHFGWKSPLMPKRYGASAAAERAREAYWRIKGGQR